MTRKCTCGHEFEVPENVRELAEGDILDGKYYECPACNSTQFEPAREGRTA